VEVPINVSSLNIVAKGNCVVVRRGGEQPEVNDRSVGNELDSACCRDEPPSERRSPVSFGRHARLSTEDDKGWLETERLEVSMT
jgi:hypothetical protein